MKTSIKYIGMAAAAAFISAGLTSCSDESFYSEGEGELGMRMVLNSELTRSEAEDEAYDYFANCRVYILKEEGIIHKFEGVSNLPSTLSLKSGHYTAEAYTGEQVPASFDKKHYVGTKEFDITTGNRTQVVLNCRIANVAAAIDEESINPELMPEYSFTIGNTKGQLVYDSTNASKIGYYTMPEEETALTYTVTGKNADGVSFSKSGVIPDVQPTHLYKLGVVYNDKPEDAVGGGFFDITVNETALLIESVVPIFGRPDLMGIEFELDKQLTGAQGSFTDKYVRIRNYGNLTGLMLKAEGDSNDCFFVHEDGRSISDIDLLGEYTSEENVNSMKEAGISWSGSYDEENNITKGYLIFGKKFLNSLPYRDKEYCFSITATDSYGKSTTGLLRIANSEAAVVIDDPVELTEIDQTKDLFAVSATSATVTVTLADANVSNPVVEYKAVDETEWQSVPILTTRAGVTCSVTLTGLKPGKTYQYRVAADNADGSRFVSKDFCFNTEEKFAIPNASLDNWSTWSVSDAISQEFGQSVKDITLPDAGGSRSFWDTGNHGSATMSVTLTTEEKSFVRSGSSAARLESQFVGIGALGKFAAGNLFAGYYCKTDGTDGVLRFGRPFNGSHPQALSVYVNYTPKTGVKSKGANANYIAEGALDQGQIYIALTTEPVDIRTKKADKLFNPNDDCIVAYGEHTFTSAYGNDGEYKRLEIPFNYYPKAKTAKPLYIVIVCTASKFGDFFSGGNGSLMYLDDFELVY